MMKRNIIVVLVGFLVIFFTLVTIAITSSNYDDFVRFDNRNVNQIESFAKIDSGVALTSEIATSYSQQRSFESVQTIFDDGNYFSSKGIGDEETALLLWNTYTDSLLKKVGQVNNIDSLNLLVSFGEDLQSFRFTKEGWTKDLTWIADYWFDYCTDRINKLDKEGEISKYSFKAISLKRRLSKQRYNVNFKTSSKEKVVYNLSSGNYAYLYNRILIRTNVFEKLVAVLFLLLPLIPLFMYLRIKSKK